MDDKSLHRTDPHSPGYCCCFVGEVTVIEGSTRAGGFLSLVWWTEGAAGGLKNSGRSAGSEITPPSPVFLRGGPDARSHAACFFDCLEPINRLEVTLCSDPNFPQIYSLRIISY